MILDRAILGLRSPRRLIVQVGLKDAAALSVAVIRAGPRRSCLAELTTFSSVAENNDETVRTPTDRSSILSVRASLSASRAIKEPLKTSGNPAVAP